jgi:hypothetical protein
VCLWESDGYEEWCGWEREGGSCEDLGGKDWDRKEWREDGDGKGKKTNETLPESGPEGREMCKIFISEVTLPSFAFDSRVNDRVSAATIENCCNAFLPPSLPPSLYFQPLDLIPSLPIAPQYHPRPSPPLLPPLPHVNNLLRPLQSPVPNPPLPLLHHLAIISPFLLCSLARIRDVQSGGLVVDQSIIGVQDQGLGGQACACVAAEAAVGVAGGVGGELGGGASRGRGGMPA